MTAPDWDLEQLEVILAAPSTWQLVVAGPGAGKSAVACQRIAYLVDEGVSASRILLISFTRTAVAELRDRIVSYADAGQEARRVRISTIDSHAWSLRVGFDDSPVSVGDQRSFDLSIAQTTELIRSGAPALNEFLETLEHVIIDEAQDVMSVRADLVVEILRTVGPKCGVTILADPTQAIYGFTSDDDDTGDDGMSLLARLEADPPRVLTNRMLKRNHRIKDPALADLFLRARKEIDSTGAAAGHIDRVQQAIRDSCGSDIGILDYSALAELLAAQSSESQLVLYRRRADVLIASSYCSGAGVEHRVRMSKTPIVVSPWLGWLFGEVVVPFIEREEFDQLWAARTALSHKPFEGTQRDACWSLLHRLAAGRRQGTIDLEQLRRMVGRSRPPVELCEPDLGYRGPILGTIHASKGREADTVVLVMPATHSKRDDVEAPRESAIYEEGRVYYVGATRARRLLIAARTVPPKVTDLDSGRVFRFLKGNQAQLEIGRDGDVDQLAHLGWVSGRDVQRVLAMHVGKTERVSARALAEHAYEWRIMLDRVDGDGVTRSTEVGQLGATFKMDHSRLWGRMDPEGRLRPTQLIPYLYLVGVTTVGIAEEKRWAVKHPFSESGLALGPVIRGFAPIKFVVRRGALG